MIVLFNNHLTLRNFTVIRFSEYTKDKLITLIKVKQSIKFIHTIKQQYTSFRSEFH